MQRSLLDSPCPCGSTKLYPACCGPYHAGEQQAPTAQALMRSRYSAFVLKKTAYLQQTWAASMRPAYLDISDDASEWQGLDIVALKAGQAVDSEGWVEFKAFYALNAQPWVLHERSRFIKEQGRWYYVDGEIKAHVAIKAAAKNAPCPCGSGKKYKRCCAAD
ncbi:MAG: YchJ family protein [Methylococcales bacterium]